MASESVENSAHQRSAESAIAPAGVGHYVLAIELDGNAQGGSQYFQRCGASLAASEMEAGTPKIIADDSSGEKGDVLPPLPAPAPPGKQTGSVARSSSAATQKQESASWKLEEQASSDTPWSVYFSSLPKKLRGGLDTRLPIPGRLDLAWSWIGAFLGILAVSALNQWASPDIDIPFTLGSFGASAVLIYAMPESKMAQPRNFIGGQFISAVIGITVRVIIHVSWIASPVAMSLALLGMQLTSTTHPPGGATALIAANFETLPKWHGYSYLITILVGSLAMQLIALIVNNLHPRRRYPTFWV